MPVPDIATLPPALADDRERPDAALGVFDTMLVRDGEAVRAAEHLARLATSVAALYDATLPYDLPARVRDAAATVAPGRLAALRVDARPRPDGLTVELALRDRRERTLPIALDPFVLPNGLGAHKWADRRLVDALARAGATPLLLDADGTVLEAAWGNVFALEGDVLVTPPADGRILPGVTRAAVLELGAGDAWRATSEEPLSLARLAAADAILVSSALAWTVPARLRDASERPD